MFFVPILSENSRFATLKDLICWLSILVFFTTYPTCRIYADWARWSGPLRPARCLFRCFAGQNQRFCMFQTSFHTLRMLNVSGGSDFGTRGRPRPRERLSREWRVTGWSERQRKEGNRRHSAGKIPGGSIRNYTILFFWTLNYESFLPGCELYVSCLF